MNAPTSPPDGSIAEECAAALAWWRAAGVDDDFTDDATVWFHSEVEDTPSATDRAANSSRDTAAIKGDMGNRNDAGSAAKNTIEDTAQRVDLLGPTPPQTLEEFREFWATAPGLDVIGPRGRVPPRGPANADLMVLVVDPEETDRDMLLSGHQGELLGQILSAMQISADKVYFASALPRHTPMADTQAIAAAGMNAVVRHHIALVAPKRLVAFGAGLAAFIAPDVSNPDTSLREINQIIAPPPVLMSEGLDSLMDMPRLKARFWRRWIEWSAQH